MNKIIFTANGSYSYQYQNLGSSRKMSLKFNSKCRSYLLKILNGHVLFIRAEV